MDSLQNLLSQLEPEIEDAEEETFLLYSRPILSQNLGFIDPKANSINIVVGERDFVIHQSPGVLSSSRAGGTTGAVLWKVTPLFAEWISSPENILFRTGILHQRSAVLELGCGISPLNALALSSKIAQYVLTDQPYVQKFIQQNLQENTSTTTSSKPPRRSSAKRGSKTSSTQVGGGGGGAAAAAAAASLPAEITFSTLDWETDQVSPSLTGSRDSSSFDAVIACDCVFNYALIQPFVQTCADVCKLRLSASSDSDTIQQRQQQQPPCLAIIAQQLRNDDVFKCWLAEFSRRFHVWRLPDEKVPEALRPGAGFVVHVGVLREYSSASMLSTS